MEFCHPKNPSEVCLVFAKGIFFWGGQMNTEAKTRCLKESLGTMDHPGIILVGLKKRGSCRQEKGTSPSRLRIGARRRTSVCLPVGIQLVGPQNAWKKCRV